MSQATIPGSEHGEVGYAITRDDWFDRQNTPAAKTR
jgi:hypothetical protein